MLLVQSTTFIIGPIAKLLGYIINVIYNGLSAIGIENVAVCIVLFTVIVQILMIPLKYKSQKFTRLTAMIQPEIMAVRKKYEGKKDQASMTLMQQETQEIYKKYGASPTGGCLPMVVQMPILFALYAVIQFIPSYISSINELYLKVANVINTPQALETLKKVKEVSIVAAPNIQNKQTIVDYLYNFNIVDWNNLLDKISGISHEVVNKITDISKVVGDVLISDSPWTLIKSHGYIHWIWILPILVYLTSYLSMKTTQIKNQPQGPGSNQMKTMTMVMPIVSVAFSIALPVGLGIYWITNSVLMTIQQIAMNKYIDKIGIDKIIAKNIEKNAAKNEKAKAKEGINPGVVSKAASLSTRNLSDINKENINEDVKPGTDSMASIARLADKYKDK